MDISSEMIHAVLPLFLVSSLGTSVTMVGAIEGLGETVAYGSKVFSGILSDYLKKRKLLACIGYGLSTVVKPLFALAWSPLLVLIARILDRLGKGIRGAPRDALISEVSPPELRGACFGLRQSLDTIGAIIGPLLAIILLSLFSNGYRLIFWLAFIPAAISVALLVFGVEDVKEKSLAELATDEVKFQGVRGLPRDYWLVVCLGCVVAFSRLGEGFLILRAVSVGYSMALAPVIMVVMNVAYTLSSYPAGHLSDRIDRRKMLLVGMMLLGVSDLTLSLWATPLGVFVGTAFWGLHMGFTQGVVAAMVAETTPKEQRGSAYGLLNMFMGITLLTSGLLGGLIWDSFGPSSMFAMGAVFVGVAIVAVIVSSGSCRVKY